MANFEKAGVQIEEDEREPRFNAIRRLTNKSPKLASLALAFIGTMSTLQGMAKEVESMDLNNKGHLIEYALENTNQEFKEEAQKLLADVWIVGSSMPEDSLYTSASTLETVNEASNWTEKMDGQLPGSAHNIYVGSEGITGTLVQSEIIEDTDTFNSLVANRSVFYVSPGDIDVGGEKGIDIASQGFGSTQDEALQNALEDAVRQLELTVDTEIQSSEKSAWQNDNFANEDTIKQKTHVSTRHFVEGYTVTDAQEIVNDQGEKEYKVSVDIHGAHSIN